MYARFIISFLGTFVISLLIGAAFFNFTQLNSIKNIINQNTSEKSSQIRNLVENEKIPISKAIGFIESSDINIKSFQSLDEMHLNFSKQEISSLNLGKTITKSGLNNRFEIYGICKIENTYIMLKPDIKNSSIAIFLSTQRHIVIIPMVLGTLLITLVICAVVKPIKEISNAAVEVSKGNFDIELSAKGHHEISILTKNFNLMIKELALNEYLHKDFISNVSHEFKTPLTSLRGYAKLLKKENLSIEKQQECADIIIAESDRLSKLSSNLLRLSELENGAINLKKERFRLDEQIRDVLVLLQNDWEKKDLKLDINMEECFFIGDKELMYQVWINLISNAIKYSNISGLLKIKLEHNNKIAIEITDNGIGMTLEQTENIFKRFYKADKSRNSSGTGLGLPIAQKIVEMHNGTISVSSQLNNGSTFKIII